MSRNSTAGVQSISSILSPTLTEKYRRNGKLQSCEPCRKSKLKCDRLGILEPLTEDLEATIGCEQQKICVSNDRITQGCKVLSFFKNRALINRFLIRLYEICEGSHGIVPEFIMREWLQKLWFHYGGVLVDQDPDRIREMSETIWRNTLTPLVFNGQTTGLEWARMATGPNLRWETLGLIAVSIGLCAIETPPADQLFTENMTTRSCLLRMMKEISEDCLAFCRHCEVLDDTFIWLLFEDSTLIGAVKGDRDYSTYRASGEAHSAVVAMGLHQGIKADENVPFFLAELRKRTFMCAYYQEISIASFLGRPPRLSYRYCTLDPPLDLTEEQLLQTGPQLAATLASLDENGYSTSGGFQYGAWYRSNVHCTMRREDVVDLALQHYTRDELLARAKVIQQKHDEEWKLVPAHIAKTFMEPIDYDNLKRLKPLHALVMIWQRNGRRANELLLQRVLIRKTGATSEKLIATARAIFTDVLQITQRYDIASVFQTSFNFFLCTHGLRSAAILAIELLKQEMLPSYPENPLLPRSQTIQDLAIFAARLGAVDPSDGCYSVCEHGKTLITKILDRILSPEPAAARQGGGGGGCNRHPEQIQPQAQEMLPTQMEMDAPPHTLGPVNCMATGVPDMGYSMGMFDVGIGAEVPMSLGQDVDFMRLLDGVDWERMDNWSGRM
ncbi:hypothetical protein VM1G_10283 [Cytospora mali]|uniref:Xylanolytic transcriptional activator regulatory domain-containing protein n=1 Tax=Cytospora mali TaxID=578113 RepID=A0A194VHY9_CYTMA|nr:hypothetical protein VM1G_10283 [Valsa mali]